MWKGYFLLQYVCVWQACAKVHFEVRRTPHPALPHLCGCSQRVWVRGAECEWVVNSGAGCVVRGQMAAPIYRTFLLHIRGVAKAEGGGRERGRFAK